MNEIILLLMTSVILFLEPSIIPYTKESIDNMMSQYGKGWAQFSKMVHCLCIFIMPIIGMSPLTILPLLGIVIALMVIFYTDLTYRNVIYIPEIFLFVAAIIYLVCKIKSVPGYFDNWGKAFVEIICSQSDTIEIVRLDNPRTD
jgi:hypothetical protein